MHYAAIIGHTECLKLLVSQQDIDVNSKTIDGWTPLHLAAEHGHTECVKLLLAVPGIHVNAQDNYGYTPLALAERSPLPNHQEIISLLKQHGPTE